MVPQRLQFAAVDADARGLHAGQHPDQRTLDVPVEIGHAEVVELFGQHRRQHRHRQGVTARRDAA